MLKIQHLVSCERSGDVQYSLFEENARIFCLGRDELDNGKNFGLSSACTAH